MTDDVKIKEPPLFLMFLLICIGTIGAVLYTPALPFITEHFGISDDLSELTMTFYLVGYAVGQLLYGPISNRLGRKPALYIGLTIAAIGALLSILSFHLDSFWLLTISRLIFALGASAGIQVIFTVIGDFYKPPRNSQVLSYLTLAFAIGPSFGITIGGFLTQYLGWASCFYFLLIYCVFLIVLVKILPETNLEKDPHATKLKNIGTEYFSKFKDKNVVIGGVLIGAAVAFSYIFATAAPFIAMDKLGLDPSKYGLLNLMPSLGLVIGALTSAAFAKYIAPLKLVLYACVITAVGAFVMLVFFGFNFLNIYTLFIPFTFALIGQPIIEANVICLALESNRNKATTTAIINFINLSLSVIFVVLISLPATVIPLSLPILFVALSLFIFYLFKKLKDFHNAEKPKS
ncbi:MAG: Inner membrane transport protein YdhC [Chlamydiia bacterium]|nr:Inner membrane transport protein YdhC [Chlamydiia bacterium]